LVKFSTLYFPNILYFIKVTTKFSNINFEGEREHFILLTVEGLGNFLEVVSFQIVRFLCYIVERVKLENLNITLTKWQI